MKTYRIQADSDNWIVMEVRVAKSGKHAGATIEKPVAYFKHFRNCAEWIYERDAREKTNLLGLVAAFESAKAEAIQACWKVGAA